MLNYAPALPQTRLCHTDAENGSYRYAQLELTHGLIRATTPVYTKYTYKANSSYKHIIAADESPAGKAIKKFGNMKVSMYHLDMDLAAAGSAVSRSDLLRKLNDLNQTGAITLSPSGVYNVYKVAKQLPRTKPEIESLISAIYTVMVNYLFKGSDCTEVIPK